MRIYDSDGNIIAKENCDLSKGFLVASNRIKDSAVPVDNITKFAWDDGDYEDVQVYVLYPTDRLNAMNNPSPEDDRDAMLVDIEYRLTMLELGV